MVYWCLLALFGALYPLTKVKIKNVSSKAIDGKKIYMIVVGALLIIVAGLRSAEVGADTAMYKQIFDWAAAGSSFLQEYISWHGGGTEPLFYGLTYYLSKVVGFNIYITIVAIISIAPIMYVIYKYSRNVYLSLLLYIGFGYFAFAMNGIRQAMAIGICMLAFDAAIEKKLKKFILLVLIAVLFHKTALLFILVYWLADIKKSKNFRYIVVISLIAVFALRTYIFQFLNIFARQSFEVASTDQGGYRMFLVMLFTMVVGWYYYYRFMKNGDVKLNENSNSLSWLLLLMLTVATLMWPIANLNAELNRMYYYYHIFIFLHIPNLVKSLNRKERMVLVAIFVAVSCYYLQAYIIGGDLKYSPYIPFWK